MKRKNPGKSCHKVAYYSKDSARQAMKTFGRARGATRFYKCPHCKPRPGSGHKGVWHLTSEE